MMEHEGVPLTLYPAVKALYAYNARSEKELSFNADDVITVLDITSETWWEGCFRGRKGYIPAAYVEHTPVDTTQQVPDDLDLAPAPPPPPEDAEESANPPPQFVAREDAPKELRDPLDESKSRLLNQLNVEIQPLAPVANNFASPAVPGEASEDEEERVEEIKPQRPMTPDRPDLAKALKIHQAKAKHKDLLPKKGSTELQTQLNRMRSGSAKHHAESEDELSKAMKNQRDRLDSKAREEEKLAKMSELEKKFVLRRTDQKPH